MLYGWSLHRCVADRRCAVCSKSLQQHVQRARIAALGFDSPSVPTVTRQGVRVGLLLLASAGSPVLTSTITPR